jgi:PAS domain S-box-containing protein
LRRALGRFRDDTDASLSHSVLDAVPDAVVVLDAEGRILTANRAACEMLARAPEALIGSGFAETVLARSSRAAFSARLRSTTAGTYTAEAPERVAVLHANGSELAADLSLHPVPAGGRPVTSVFFRLIEADTSATNAAETRRRTLQTIVDAIPDPIVAVDRAGHVVLRNPASARLRDRSLQGTPEGGGGADTLSPDEWQDAEAVMESGIAVFQAEETRYSGRTHLATRVPVCTPSGAVVGLVAIAHDVTALKAAEAQLLADKNAAEAAAQANREFLATTSHEVRTLMSGVTGMTSLLLETSLTDEQHEFVDTVRTSGDALLAVINDILDFSKIEAGMLQIETAPYPVRQAVAGALSMVSQQAAAKGLDLTADIDDAVAETIYGDVARVRQVLINLLANAIKFTETGGVRVHVRLDTDTPQALVFSVEDTGEGIAADRLDAVFERFEQAASSTARTHGGTGLGLSICRRLVGMMGGELTVDSAPGQGSVFQFTVPAALPTPDAEITFEEFGAAETSGDSEASEDGEASGAPEASEDHEMLGDGETSGNSEASGDGEEFGDGEASGVPEASGDGEMLGEPEPPAEIEVMSPAEVVPSTDAPRSAGAPSTVVMPMDAILPAARVLVVEDDAVLQRVTSLTLRRLGYMPDLVGNGLEAVEAVRARAYDVVLMDMMMPVMDGYTATRHIRADVTLPQMPAIVAVTANAMPEDRVRCLAAGCDEYLSKPVDPRKLATTIERAIRERETTR